MINPGFWVPEASDLAGDDAHFLSIFSLKFKVLTSVERVNVKLMFQFVGDDPSPVVTYSDTSKVSVGEAKDVLKNNFSCLCRGNSP